MTSLRETAEIVACIRDLLSDSSKWIKIHKATGGYGDHVFLVDGFNPHAHSYCLLGAVEHCTGRLWHHQVNDEARKIIRLAMVDLDWIDANDGFTEIQEVNDLDTFTHEDLVKVLDRAVEFANARSSK